MHLTALVGGETVCLLAVADGHGGPEAAQLCEDTLLQTIVKEAGAADAASLQAACSRAFATVHAAVCERESADAGACVTVVAINEGRGEVTCAHVGDSSALLVEESGHRPLTAEHRLSNSPEEQARVVACGARLAKARSDDGYFGVGPIRAWPGGLAVCRTVGDADCAYVDPTPVVCTLAFERPGGAKVIACSDGVWDALSEERVAKHVRAAATPADAAAKVVRAAIRARGLRDDTTSVVAWAGEPSWGSRRRSPKPRRGSSRHLASLLSSSLASSSSSSTAAAASASASSVPYSDSASDCSESPTPPASDIGSIDYSPSHGAPHLPPAASASALDGFTLLTVDTSGGPDAAASHAGAPGVASPLEAGAAESLESGASSRGGASPSHGASPSQSRRARTRLSARRLFGADTARLPSIPGSDSAIPAPEKIDAAEKASAGAAGAEVAVPATLGEAVAELRR